MDFSLQRLDLTQIYCDVDDFYQSFEVFNARHIARLPYEGQAKRYQSRLSISEVMTIVIAFYGSVYKIFKAFYTQKVRPYWRGAFPELVSYNRFVELMPWSVMAQMAFLNHSCLGQMSGVSFIDSTSLAVCHNERATRHKVFKDCAGWGKSSVSWYFGFKLYLLLNHQGELLAVALTPGNTDDRKPVAEMSQGLFGKLFADRGYVSQALFAQLRDQDLQLIARRRKNMKNTLMTLLDKVLLRKRSLIETVNDQLKNICQIEHSRHHSWLNFLVNLVSGLIAYSYHPNKPSIDIPNFDPKALPPAIF